MQSQAILSRHDLLPRQTVNTTKHSFLFVITMMQCTVERQGQGCCPNINCYLSSSFLLDVNVDCVLQNVE